MNKFDEIGRTKVSGDVITVGIAGASGYLGVNLVAKFVQDERVALSVLHHSTPVNELGEQYRSSKGDLVSGEGIDSWVAGCDVVVNLAYLWRAGLRDNLVAARNLFDACARNGVRRLVHLSTAAVVGRAHTTWVDEATHCRPVTEYGKCKLAIEKMLLDKADSSGIDLVILRPTSVFGPMGAPLAKLCSDLRYASWLKNYLRACLFGARAMNLVHVENVTAAIIVSIKHQSDFAGTNWFVSEDDMAINNFLDMERLGRSRLGVKAYPVPVLPFPSIVLEVLLRMLRRNIVDPGCRFRPDGLRALGYSPVRDFESGLCEYFDWYLKNFPDAVS